MNYLLYQKTRFVKGYLAYCPQCKRESANFDFCIQKLPEQVLMIPDLRTCTEGIDLEVSKLK